jgi:hypothetical protein
MHAKTITIWKVCGSESVELNHFSSAEKGVNETGETSNSSAKVSVLPV